jgi:tetratricopeptide (TPR) repeat protein
MLDISKNLNMKKTKHEFISDLYNWIGLFQFLSGDFENARCSLQTAIDENPLATGPILKLALVDMELGLISEMSESLENALRIDETDAAAYYHRGEILAMSGRMDDAIADFSRAVQLDVEFHSAHVRRARAYQTLGNIIEAKDILKKSIKLFPDNPELYHALGECYAMENNFDEAITIFDNIERMSPDNPQISLTKATIVQIKNGGSDAEYGASLANIIEKYPDFGTARIQYAGYLLKQKDHKGALEQYEIAAQQARSYQDLITIHSHHIISKCQLKVIQRFPDLCDIVQ